MGKMTAEELGLFIFKALKEEGGNAWMDEPSNPKAAEDSECYIDQEHFESQLKSGIDGYFNMTKVAEKILLELQKR